MKEWRVGIIQIESPAELFAREQVMPSVEYRILNLRIRIPTESQVVGDLSHDHAFLSITGPLIGGFFRSFPNKVFDLLFGGILRLSHDFASLPGKRISAIII